MIFQALTPNAIEPKNKAILKIGRDREGVTTPGLFERMYSGSLVSCNPYSEVCAFGTTPSPTRPRTVLGIVNLPAKNMGEKEFYYHILSAFER